MRFPSALRAFALTLTTLAALAGSQAAQAEIIIPYTFAAGSPAKAGEVNANFQSLANAISSLSARLDKTEGKLNSADLVGTYRFQSLQTELNAGVSNNVRVYTYDGTVTLKADGSGSVTTTDTGANLAISGGGTSAVSVARSIFTQDNPTGNVTWTLSGNTVSFGGGAPFFVVDGGRLLVQAATNTADATSKMILIVRTN
jgi:hypothetical protein